MAEVLIGLGSNLGDREANLSQAVRRLLEAGRLVAVSSLYETAPVGFVEQGDFLNACLWLRTAGDPAALLALAHDVEQELARLRTVPNGPRTMDVDLLLWRDGSAPVTSDRPPLLPHPRMHLRRFVLEPLTEIAADWVHPTLHRTIAELLAALPAGEAVRRLSRPSWPPAPTP